MNYQGLASSEYNNALIKDIVASNYKAASIFERYGIDFCCKGNRPLQRACEEKGINSDPLITEIKELFDVKAIEENRYNEWELDYLIQHILNNHHNYLKRAIPEISRHAGKIAEVHGERHPELYEVSDLFSRISKELVDHMQKEELVLFPMINTLVQFNRTSSRPGKQTVSLRSPIAAMEDEHNNAGLILEQIRNLTKGFRLPADACNTFRVTYQELEEFERDLHKHVFLENSILFPKAIALEDMYIK